MFAFRSGAPLPIVTSMFEFLRTKSPMIPSASFPPGKSDVFLGDISITSTFPKENQVKGIGYWMKQKTFEHNNFWAVNSLAE